MKRNLSQGETAFLPEMLKLTDAGNTYFATLKEVFVQAMDDGGMGSLAFFYQDDRLNRTHFGGILIAVSFTDFDGVEVIASIYLDQFDRMYELDMWKTDFLALLNPIKMNYKIDRIFS